MPTPKNLTPAEIRLRQQANVHSSWAKTEDRAARTKPGQVAANTTRFEDQVDPDRKLSPEERAKRVANARQAHLKRIALKSAKARRLRKQAANGSADGGAE